MLFFGGGSIEERLHNGLSSFVEFIVFSRHANSCVNCNTQGHGMRDCTRICINVSDSMKIELQEEEPVWRRRQQRMRDDRTPSHGSRHHSNSLLNTRSNRDRRRYNNGDYSRECRRDSSSRSPPKNFAHRRQGMGLNHDNTNPEARTSGAFITCCTDM